MNQTQDLLRPGSLQGPPLRRAFFFISTSWLFGSVWVSATSGTPYTNFAKALGASEFQFGVLTALPYLASLVSLPASLLTEATGKRKAIFLAGLYLQRLTWFPIALVPIYLFSHDPDGSPRHAMLWFLAMVLLMHSFGAFGGPAWLSWMADIVPERARGKYFSKRRVLGTFTAIPTAAVAGYLLDRYTSDVPAMTTLHCVAGVFMIAAVFGMVDIALFHPVPEVPRQPRTGSHLLRSMRAPLHDRNFLWFAGYVATMTFGISFTAQFVTLYVLEILSTPGGGESSLSSNTITQLMVIIMPLVAQLLTLPIWGRAVDRMGKRPLLILAGLGLVPVAAGWSFVSRDHIWLGYALSALGAAFWAGIEVANLNLVLEMSGTAESGEDGSAGGTGYVAVNSVIINLAGCAGGIASGVVAQALKDADFRWVTPLKTFTFYDVLFVLAALVRLAAIVVFVPSIHEGTARPTHEALRYMTSNIYNNLFTVAMQPVRLLRTTVFREPGTGSSGKRPD